MVVTSIPVASESLPLGALHESGLVSARRQVMHRLHNAAGIANVKKKALVGFVPAKSPSFPLKLQQQLDSSLLLVLE